MSLPQTIYIGGAKYSKPAPKLLYRIPHDMERDSRGKFVLGKRDGTPSRYFPTNPIPEPYWAYPDQTVPVKNFPRLVSMIEELNPEYTRDRALQLLGTGLCWCNNTWGVFSKAIITGGAVLEAERVSDGKVYFKSIYIKGQLPTKQEILDNHLSTIAVSVNLSGGIGYMTRPNGHGTRSKIRMYIVRETLAPLWFWEDELHRLPPGVDPQDPLWLP